MDDHIQRFGASPRPDLEETVRTTLAARQKEDRELKASSQQEIARLRSQHEDKLAKCDQEILLKEEDVKEQERRKTAALEAKHKEELEALQDRHAEEMAQRIRDTQAYIKIAVEAARDDKGRLDRALRDKVIMKEREFDNKKKALDEKRKLEDEDSKNAWFQRIQEQVSHSNESTSKMSFGTLLMRPLSSPSPPYSDERDERMEADLPSNAEKRKIGYDDASSIPAAQEAGASSELRESTAPQAPAVWDFAARYDKSKDVISKVAAPLTVSNSSKQQATLPPKLQLSGMPKHPSPKSKKAKKGEERNINSSGKNSIEKPSTLPPGYTRKPIANSSSQVSKPPHNAPTAPRGQPIPVAGAIGPRDYQGILPRGQRVSIASRPSKRGRLQQDREDGPILEAMPPLFGPNKRRSGGDSWRPPYDSSYDRNSFEYNSYDRNSYDLRNRYEPKAEPELSRNMSFNQFPVLKGLDNGDRNEARVEFELRPSKTYDQDTALTPKGSVHKSSANGESPSPCFYNSSGSLPTCPARSLSNVERKFIDLSSDSGQPRAVVSIVETGSPVENKPPIETQFCIRQIRYQRDDDSIFEWTQSGTGKTELRLDNFLYKAYINNELCHDWHYSNWAIIPDHVELLECEFDLAFLHVKRTKTVQAGADLWVRFENKEVLQEFIKSFVFLAKFPAHQIIELDEAAIPHTFRRN